MSRRGGQAPLKSDRVRRTSPSVRSSHHHHQSSSASHGHHGNSGSGGGRHGRPSRSPLRSKLMQMSGSIADGHRERGGSNRNRGEDPPPRHNHSSPPGRHGDRDRPSSSHHESGGRRAPKQSPRKLRMDEHHKSRDGGMGGSAEGGGGSSHYRSSGRGGAGSSGGGDKGSKKKTELDRVVKRAREDERASNFWNKKIIEEEEKDPERWGHSGFKELYRKDFQRNSSASPGRRGGPVGGRRKSFSRSRSRSMHSRSRSRSPMGASKHHIRKRIVGPAGGRLSRSTSPRHAPARKRSPLLSAASKRQNGNSHHSANTLAPKDRHRRTATSGTHHHGHPTLSSRQKSDVLVKRSRPHHQTRGHRNGSISSESSVSPTPAKKRSKALLKRHGSPTSPRTAAKKAAKRIAQGKKPVGDSDSISSSSLSSSSDDDDEDVLQLHAKSQRKRGVKGRKGSFSYSSSEATSSSDASTELRLKKKRKLLRGGISSSSSSSSLSSSSSEDDDVSSDESDVSVLEKKTKALKNKVRAASISSSSSISSKASGTIVNKQPPPYTSAKEGKNLRAGATELLTSKKTGSLQEKGKTGEKPLEKKISNVAAPKQKPKNTSEAIGKPHQKSSKSAAAGENKTGSKKSTSTTKEKSVPSSTTKNGPATVTATSTTGKESKAKKQAKQKEEAKAKKEDLDSGETNTSSGSESSSDSDSEPKMTLSERFAKLTQMTQTDKREFAKPLLSLNEIDTKLKVVKDLRNADVKVFVDGQPPPPPTPPEHHHHTNHIRASRLRPRTPDYNEGERRYSSAERRRHFERMTRDEPDVRGPEWSDSRVRYEYYLDRGYFKDRPCAFDEFVKWEEWWYKYRDWLASEGYYNHQRPPSEHQHHHGPPPSGYLGPGGNAGAPPPPQSHNHEGWHAHHHLGHGSAPGPPHHQGIPPSRHHHHPRSDMGHNHNQGPPPPGPMSMVPLSSRAHFGRPDGSAYLQAGQQQNIRRRIGRTTNGSLVVRVGGASNGFRTTSSGARIGPPNHHNRR